MAAIRLQNVTKVFKPESTIARRPIARDDKRVLPAAPAPEIREDGLVHALDGLNLVVPNGRTTVIVGPSGCGKSTLLRVVAGLTDYVGLVAYDGKDMSQVPVKERRIGMVFQNYALYPHFYGLGNLSFFFRINKAPDAEAEERIRITADMMGFGFRELLPRKPGTLSGGQQQRLAIARALVRQPQLFLFDEPLSNLDAKLRTSTRVEIKRLLHRFEITAIYVTHDQTEAMALGDEIAVMRRGKIEQVGPFFDIVRDPINAFVAGFLGLPPMNLINGEIQDGRLVLGTATQFQIPPKLAAQVSSGQHIILGIRPEAARIVGADAAQQEDGLVLSGTIDVVEPDFGRRQQTAYISAGEVSCSVTAPLDIRLTQGYTTQVLFPRESLYFFDAESEARIDLGEHV
jgi:ABC-type sugar transport system ATPase subunit